MAEDDAELIPCPGGCNCFVPRVIVEAVIARREERLRADLAAPDASVSQRADRAAATIHGVFSDLFTKIPSDKTAHIEIMANIIATEFTGTDAVRQAQREICVWSLDDLMDGDLWETDCDQAFQFNDGGPEDNHFKFCYCCGKPLDVLRRTEIDEADGAAALRAEGKGKNDENKQEV